MNITPTTELPNHIKKAFLMLDPKGGWTGVERPWSGWLAKIPDLVEGENFELSDVPAVRRAKLTAAGIALREQFSQEAENQMTRPG